MEFFFFCKFSEGGQGIWMSNVQGVCTNGSIALKKCCVMGVISTIQEYQKKRGSGPCLGEKDLKPKNWFGGTTLWSNTLISTSRYIFYTQWLMYSRIVLYIYSSDQFRHRSGSSWITFKLSSSDVPNGWRYTVNGSWRPCFSQLVIHEDGDNDDMYLFNEGSCENHDASMF